MKTSRQIQKCHATNIRNPLRNLYNQARTICKRTVCYEFNTRRNYDLIKISTSCKCPSTDRLQPWWQPNRLKRCTPLKCAFFYYPYRIGYIYVSQLLSATESCDTYAAISNSYFCYICYVMLRQKSRRPSWQGQISQPIAIVEGMNKDICYIFRHDERRQICTSRKSTVMNSLDAPRQLYRFNPRTASKRI